MPSMRSSTARSTAAGNPGAAISELRTALVKLGFHVDEDEVASRLNPGNVLLVASLEPAAGRVAGHPPTQAGMGFSGRGSAGRSAR